MTGSTIIFGLYNALRAFVDTFNINAYDDLPSSHSSRGYVNSSDIEVYYTFFNHSDSRASPKA